MFNSSIKPYILIFFIIVFSLRLFYKNNTDFFEDNFNGDHFGIFV